MNHFLQELKGRYGEVGLKMDIKRWRERFKKSADEIIYGGLKGFAWNTTLAIFMTNAKFSKSQLCKISDMAHDGLARSIRPVHTSADGDSIYATKAICKARCSAT